MTADEAEEFGISDAKKLPADVDALGERWRTRDGIRGSGYAYGNRKKSLPAFEG